MWLIGLFGALALAIASVGIYGVMAFIVDQRTAEIGLRMALGAVPGDVVRLIGLAPWVSWPWAWPPAWSRPGRLRKTLQAFLFQVQPHDLVVYIAASAVLMGAGVLAAFNPERRAARVDPIIALRAD